MASTPRPESAHNARRLMNIAAAARGREPLAYELEIIPFFVGELPSNIDRVCFVWERGSKIFATEAETVNPHTHAAFWRQFLKQTVTIYRDPNGQLLPKEYTFKVQQVRGNGGVSSNGSDGSRRTVGKAKLDLSRFCGTHDVPSLPQELFLQLRPAGKVKVSVKATWLKDVHVDMDALTEASFGTHRSGVDGRDFEEQDLSGFDAGVAEQGEAISGGSGSGGGTGVVGSQQHATTPRSAPQTPGRLHGHGRHDSSGNIQQRGSPQPVGGGVNHGRTGGSPRILASGTSAARGGVGGSNGAVPAGATTPLPGVIPPFSVGLSPDEERAALEQDKARQAAFHAAEVERMRHTIEEQLRSELHEALAKHQGRSWRDLFCCCWPRRLTMMSPVMQELAMPQSHGDEAQHTLLAERRGAVL